MQKGHHSDKDDCSNIYVVGAQKNHLSEAILLSSKSMFVLTVKKTTKILCSIYMYLFTS